MGNSVRLYFGGSKITVDGDCSHEIKSHLLLGRKVIDQPRQHIKKQRHYFTNKVRLVKAMVFLMVMYGCESWTVKKAECWRTDAFELWCWRSLLRVPWTARWSNQCILKISPGTGQGGLVCCNFWTQLSDWTELSVSSVQFSHSVMCDSLQPHGLQHARLPCPSPMPRVYSNSCPLSWWCHPTISSSVVPFSSCL